MSLHESCHVSEEKGTERESMNNYVIVRGIVYMCMYKREGMRRVCV